jgi:hypothetical protein
MKWRLLGLVLFALGLYAAWRTSIDMRDQTRVVVGAFVAIFAGAIGTRLMLRPRSFR